MNFGRTPAALPAQVSAAVVAVQVGSVSHLAERAALEMAGVKYAEPGTAARGSGPPHQTAGAAVIPRPFFSPSGGLGCSALAPLELQITVGRGTQLRVVAIDDFPARGARRARRSRDLHRRACVAVRVADLVRRQAVNAARSTRR